MKELNNENIDYKLNKIASEVIKRKRIEKGYSLEELANKLNNVLTRQSLFRYENNFARMKIGIFNKICYALDENPNDVWNEINNIFYNSEKINENTFNETQVLFDKSKDILSDDDRATIEFIMKKTIDNYEKNKNNE